jgi:hypothetical protein
MIDSHYGDILRRVLLYIHVFIKHIISFIIEKKPGPKQIDKLETIPLTNHVGSFYTFYIPFLGLGVYPISETSS